eukprot:5115751-Ditylum_brightwellii.AAC.1
MERVDFHFPVGSGTLLTYVSYVKSTTSLVLRPLADDQRWRHACCSHMCDWVRSTPRTFPYCCVQAPPPDPHL